MYRCYTIDDKYKDLYESDISQIKLCFVYLNNNNEIQDVINNFFSINNNILKKEELISLIKKKSFINNKRYKVLSILKYNIDLIPEDIKFFLINGNNTNNFLSVIKNIDMINWKKSIKMFKNLNELFIFFSENSINNMSKKIYFNKKNNDLNTFSQNCRKNDTKKIRLFF